MDRNRILAISFGVITVASIFANPGKWMSKEPAQPFVDSFNRAPASVLPSSDFTSPVPQPMIFHPLQASSKNGAAQNFTVSPDYNSPQPYTVPPQSYESSGLTGPLPVYSNNQVRPEYSSVDQNDSTASASSTRKPAQESSNDSSPSHEAVGSYGGLPTTTATPALISNSTSHPNNGSAVSAPASLVAAGNTGSIELSWSPVSSDTAVSYTIERSLSPSSGFTVMAAGLSNTTYSDTSATAGVTYYYRIRSINQTGGSYSSVASAVAMPSSGIPTAPTLTLIASNNAASLSWTSSTGIAPITYSVERSLTSGSGFSTVTSGLTSPVFVDSSLVDGTLYYYRIQGHNAAGVSSYSAEISAKPIDAFLLGTAVAGQASVTLTWPSAIGASTFDIQYGTTTGTYTTTLSNQTSPFTVTGLTAGTQYFFSIKATNTNNGLTLSTNELSATPLDSFTITSVTPTDIGKLKIIWPAVTGATSYDIGCGLTSGDYTASVATNQTSPATLSGLSNATTYYCRVTAKNSSGSADSTAEVSATTFSLLTYTWPFDAGTDASYSFDSSKLELVGGVSRLKNFTPTDSSYLGNDFKDAILSGVKWDSPNAKLVLDSSSDSGELNSRWTPQYDKIQGYWKLNGSVNASLAVGELVQPIIGPSLVTQGSALMYQSGQQKQAIQFDGTSFLNGDNTSVNIASDITVQLWVKTTASTVQVLAAKYGGSDHGWELVLRADGTIGFDGRTGTGVYQTSGSSLTKINDNVWHHVVGSRAGNVFKIFIDGKLEASTANDAGSFGNINQLVIGNQDIVPTLYAFVGALDEPAIWSTALTSAEVKTLYERQSARFTGTLLSRIMSSGAAASWAGLKYLTTLPYGKEISGTTDSEAIYSQSSANLPSSLVSGMQGYWHLDEISGTTLADSSGQNHHATAINSPTLNSAGVRNRGLQLNPGATDNQRIELGTPLITGTSDFTISSWFSINSLTDINYIAGNYGAGNDGVEFYVQQGRLGIYIAGTYVFSTTPTTASQWHHALVTRIAGMVNVYLDGTLVQSGSAPDSIPGTSPFTIGNGYDYTSERFSGNLDEVAVWNRGLSASEITTVYEQTRSLGAGLVGLWHLNETSGTTLMDSSGGGHHGINNGLTLAAAGKLGKGIKGTGSGGASLPADLSNTNVMSASFWYNSTTYMSPGVADARVMLEFTPNFITSGSGFVLAAADCSNAAFPCGSMTFGSNGAPVNVKIKYYNNLTTPGWHHYVINIDRSKTPNVMKLYQDGSLVSLIDASGYQTDSTANFGNSNFYLLSRNSAGLNTLATIDEFAVWSRSLSTTEVQQLYQRGANRILTQARTCANADCSDDPTGSNWVGSAASASSYLSEINNSTTQSPDFLFSNFGVTLANQPYFQYRAVLQSDDSATSPDLVSVSAGPARFDGSNPVVMPVDGPTFAVYTGFTTTLGASCTGTPKFQLSHDKQTWYYYSAGMWNTTTAGVTQASDSSVINTNIGTFGAIAGTGALYAKIFYPSNTSTACEIDSIAVAGADVNSTNTTNPGAFTVTSITSTNGTATLNWNAASASTSYKVCYGTTQALANACATFVTVTGTSTTISSLVNDTQYYFNVVASNASGTTASNTPVVTTPMAIPSTPTSLAAVSGLFSTQLTWNASTGSGNVTYQVKRATVTGGPYTTIASGVMTNAYSDLTALANVSYYYVVSASNAGGSSANSNEASATAIGSFSITSAIGADSTISLGWGSALGASSYDVHYGTSSNLYSATLTNQSNPVTATGFTAGTVYYLSVTAKNTSGSANNSNEVIVKPVGPVTPVITQGVNSLTFTWPAATGATRYNILYGVGSLVSTASNVTSPYTLTGLTGGSLYQIRFVAVNDQNGYYAYDTAIKPYTAVNYTWTFDQGTDSAYTFDSSKIELVGGVCRLSNSTPTDASYVMNDFKDATLSGVKWNSTAQTITLDSDSDDGELNSQWTPKYNQIFGYWKMNGTVNASIANQETLHSTIGPHLTAENPNGTGLSYTSSTQRQAVHFDGVDDILVNHSTRYDQVDGNAFTLSTWIKPHWTSGYITLVANRNSLAAYNWILYQHTDNGELSFHGAGQFKSSYIPPNDVWTHVMVTVSASGTSKIYANGIEVYSSSLYHFNSAAPGTLAIGAWENTNEGYYSGDLDELALWNATLSPTEVKTIYERQHARYTGTLLSRVMSSGASSSWNGLNYLTTLPFGKEIPSGNESIDQYSKLTTVSAPSAAIWRFDEASGAGSILDTSGNGINGTPYNVISGSTGKFNNSATFTGSSAVDLTDNVNLSPGTGNFAISVWFKTSNNYSGTQGWIYSDYGNAPNNLIVMRVSNGGGSSTNNKLMAYMRDGTPQSIEVGSLSTVNDGLWHMAIMSKTNKTLSLYLDGVLQQSVTNASIGNIITSDGRPPSIGRYNDTSTNHYFYGDLDELMVWKGAISTTEAARLYQTSRPVAPILSTNLVGLWHLNETSGTAIADSSVNANHGSLVGTTTLNVPGKFKTAIHFDGVDGRVEIPGSTSNNLSSNKASASAWVYLDSYPPAGKDFGVLAKGSSYYLTIDEHGKPRIYIYGTSPSGWQTAATSIPLKTWTHIGYTYDGTTSKVYFNGVADSSNGRTGNIASNNFTLGIGAVGTFTGIEPDRRLQGSIDEVALWSRALNSDEMAQLYQRGASRVFLQARSCSSADCSDDPNGANWKGSSNSTTSYLSDALNSTALSPQFLFANYGVSLANNPYFQYRAILESDDVNALPGLVSVSAGPARFDATNPTVIPINGPTFDILSSFTVTLGANGCSGIPKYQLSTDKTTWYYYSSGMWNTASGGISNASDASTINSNISTLSSVSGVGKLYVKAFLPSNLTTACEIDSIAVGGGAATPAISTNPNAFLVTAIVASDGGATLTWNAATSATGYTICYGTSQADADACVFSTTTTNTTLGIGTLANDTRWYFNVSATTTSGRTPASIPVSTVPMSAPSVPSTLTAVGGNYHTNLTWAVSSGSGTITYNVKRSTTSGGPYTLLASGVTSSAYTDFTALAGTQYYYVVTARNAGGESAASTEATTSSLGSFAISSAVGSNGVITLTWGSALGATSYDVKYGTATANYSATSSGVASTSGISGFTNGTDYYLVVIAKNASGASTSSTEVRVNPVLGYSITPTAGVNSVSVAFSNSATGATSSKLEYGTSPGIYTTTINGPANPQVISSLTSGTTYYFRSTAWNAVNGTYTTAEVSVMPFQNFTYHWSFDTGSESSYSISSSSLMDFTGGVCRLTNFTPFDSNTSATQFGGAVSNFGLNWDSTLNGIILNAATDEAELNSSWTPNNNSMDGYWKFNGTEDALITDGFSLTATVGNNGVSHNANGTGMAFYHGQQRQGVFFDGVDDYATIPNSGWNPGTGDFSVSYWINVNSVANNFRVFSKRDTCNHGSFFSTMIDVSGAARFEVDQDASATNYGTLLGNQAVNDKNWHFITYTRKGTALSIYVDGKLDASTNTTGVTNISNNSVYDIGGITACALISNTSFILDEAAVWKVALSAPEIQMIYEHQSARSTGSIISRVMNAGSSITWKGLNWISSLPFGKELTPNQKGDSLDYIGLMPSKKGLVGHWRMDETTSATAPGAKDLIDDSGNGNHGSMVTPGVEFGDQGKVNRSINLRGGKFRVDAPAGTFSSNVATVSFWMNWDGSSSKMPVGFFNYDIYIAAGVIGFNTSNADIYGTSSASLANHWVHVVAEFHPTDVTLNKLYFDGVQQTLTQNMGTPMPSNAALNDTFYLGGWGGPDVYNFSSRLDEISVWNRTLSQQEITQLAAANDNLMTGNIGLWHFNETASGSVGGADFKDDSGNANHGYATTPSTVGVQGKLGKAAYTALGGRISMGTSNLFNVTDQLGFSGWYSHDAITTGDNILVNKENVYELNAHGTFQYALQTTSGPWYWVDTGVVVPLHQWYHLGFSYNSNLSSNQVKLYLNGALVYQGNYTGTFVPSTSSFELGSRSSGWPGGVHTMTGRIDEVGIWNRALSTTEMKQLYQRGANRLKFQVRACASAGCSDDPNGLNWKGPDGTAYSYFTEMNNTTSGVVNSATPSLLFANFPIGNLTGQYFQYRMNMESDDTNVTSPDLIRVEAGPARYDTSVPFLHGLNGSSYLSLTAFSITLGDKGCSGVPHFQFSKDKTTWYWYNGTTWVTALNWYTQANDVTTANANISTLTSVMGTGTIYVREQLPSDGTTACEIDDVSISGTKY